MRQEPESTMIADVAFYRAQVVRMMLLVVSGSADAATHRLCRCTAFADRASSNDLAFDIHL
jgi:hypothetical protein